MKAISERTSRPLLMSSETLRVLARWLKCNGGRSHSAKAPHQILSERYPVDLFSEAETEALLTVLRG